MKSVFLAIIFIFLFMAGSGQISRRMVVWDAVNHKAIPYATVKVMHTKDGSYADEDGKIGLNVSEKDSLLVTCVGYASKIILAKYDTIQLEPILINLGEVKVRPLKRKEETIGLAKSLKYFSLLFSGNLIYEIVLKINLPDERLSYHIKGVRINTESGSDKSMARLHIYNQNKDSLPGKEILTEDILINNHTNGIIDLSRLNLFSEERVLFVGIESIQSKNRDHPDSGEDFKILVNKVSKPISNEFIKFGITLFKKHPMTYTRTIHDPKYIWELVDSQHVFSRILKTTAGHPANLMVSLIID